MKYCKIVINGGTCRNQTSCLRKDENMIVLTNHHHEIENRNVISILETVDVTSGERKVLQEFENLIEAPNWLKDGKNLIYNSMGHIYSYEIATGKSTLIDSGICDHCNNDHVLSPDHQRLAVSHHTYEDGQSRIYTLPIDGGVPVLVTPIAPSYLHGWSPDGKTLAY
jgi:Tol biopolymer transport system component